MCVGVAGQLAVFWELSSRLKACYLHLWAPLSGLLNGTVSDLLKVGLEYPDNPSVLQPGPSGVEDEGKIWFNLSLGLGSLLPEDMR